jgi:hypothetical protein
MAVSVLLAQFYCPASAFPKTTSHPCRPVAPQPWSCDDLCSCVFPQMRCLLSCTRRDRLRAGSTATYRGTQLTP